MSRGLALLSAVLVLALLPWLGTPAFATTDTVDPGIGPGPAPGATIESPEEEAIPPDWKGLRQDTKYFLAYQFAVIGVLYVLPESVTNWDRSGDHLSKPARRQTA